MVNMGNRGNNDPSKIILPGKNGNMQSQEYQQQKKENQTRQQRRQIERELNKNITRGDAIELTEEIAKGQVNKFGDMLREPLRSVIMQAMAIQRLLIEKGIIKNDKEVQDCIDRLVKNMNEQSAENEGDGDYKEKGEESQRKE